ncbi:MAG: CBS domain-containing protein [Candidatus Rokuibacteriota bacterium]
MTMESWRETAGHEARPTHGTERLVRPEVVWLGIGAIALSLPLLLARRGRPAGRRVADVMVRDIVTVDASETLRDAAGRMREANVGVLPVLEGGQVRGVITDRDLVVRGMARGVDTGTTRVSDCMTDTVVCARPDWDVDEARRVMAECQIGRLPVVDDRNRLLGIVTLGSLALRATEQDETLDAAREVSRRSARA